MFTAAWNVLSYVFGKEEKGSDDTDNRDTDNGDTDNDNLNCYQGVNNEEERKEFEGTVTHVFDSNGLVDNEVYFSFDQVIGGARPSKCDQVHVRAVRHHAEGGWHAEQVVIVTNWDDDDDDDDDDIWKPSEIVGTVTHTDGQTGYVNLNLFYDLNECEHSDFIPYKGDWVKVSVTYGVGDDAGMITVMKLEPLRLKECDGVISASKTDHGYIDEEVFFISESLVEGFTPRKWEAVHYRAIESEQRGCSWRAIFIEPSQAPNQANLKLILGPLQKSFTSELLADKEGVCVTEELDFGTVTIGTKGSLVVEVKNTREEGQIYQRCHLTATNSQIKIKNIHCIKDSQLSCNDHITEDNIELLPGMTLRVNLELDARFQGQERPLLVFTFDKFKIGRYVRASVVDPLLDQVLYTESSAGTLRQPYKDRPLTNTYDDSWVIPGERLNWDRNSQLSSRLKHNDSRSNRRKAGKFSNKLKQYTVPTKFQQLIEDRDIQQILDFTPALTDPLCFNNYLEKFRHLLYLEEVQQQIEYQRHRLEKVCLRAFKNYLVLTIQDLSEKTFKLMPGDRVILSESGTTDEGYSSGPKYEGVVNEVVDDNVFLKFHINFHDRYAGEEYDVEFRLNRFPIKRCHYGTEMALSLGNHVLFPLYLDVKPAKLSLQSSLWKQNKTKSSVSSADLPLFNKILNTRQRSAVKRILQGQSRPLPYIIFGPPGTGKTITLVEAVLQVFLHEQSSRILISSSSNNAVDLITEKLHNSGVLTEGDMVRLYAKSRAIEDIPEIVRRYSVISEDIHMASMYRILLSTCVSAGGLVDIGLRHNQFTHVFLDEAGQSTEPETMIPLSMISQTDGQIILAGDPHQLGPVLMSGYAKEMGLQYSLLERLISMKLYDRDEDKFSDHGAYDPLLVTKLVNNYRSHPAILNLPSRLFYHGELISSGDTDRTHLFTDWEHLQQNNVPMVFHGIQGQEMREPDSPSLFNPMEVVEVVKYLQLVLRSGLSSVTCDNIGIVTPYQKQVEKIKQLIGRLNLGDFMVGSVEQFQGQERKVIIISTVRSHSQEKLSDKAKLGFMVDAKRFNVAVTRAEALLIVIGDPYILYQVDHWREFIDHCVELGVYKGCDLPLTAVNL